MSRRVQVGLGLLILLIAGGIAGAQVGGEPTVATQTFTHEDVVTYTVPTETVVSTETVTEVTTVTVTEPTTSTSPTTTEPEPIPGAVVDQATYTCNSLSPREFALIRLNANTDGNTLTLDPGCNGVVIHRIEIRNDGGGDCIKVRPPAPGATDVTIEGGWCIAHGSSANHTDGLQAGAGLRITLSDVAFIGGCAGNCGNADFFTSGWGGGTPTDIVCDGCAFGPFSDAEEFSHGMNLGSPSLRSGARNTRICQGDFFAVTIAGATAPVNDSNEIVLHSDPSYWSKCSQEALLDYVGG